jgi:hypothetical protein
MSAQFSSLANNLINYITGETEVVSSRLVDSTVGVRAVLAGQSRGRRAVERVRRCRCGSAISTVHMQIRPSIKACCVWWIGDVDEAKEIGALTWWAGCSSAAAPRCMDGPMGVRNSIKGLTEAKGCLNRQHWWVCQCVMINWGAHATFETVVSTQPRELEDVNEQRKCELEAGLLSAAPMLPYSVEQCLTREGNSEYFSFGW